MSVDVQIAARAEQLLAEADLWWRANRADSPNLLIEEFEGTLEQIESNPGIGVPYPHPRSDHYHRILLPRTRQHIYYEYRPGEEVAVVVSFWSALRGSPPRLD